MLAFFCCIGKEADALIRVNGEAALDIDGISVSQLLTKLNCNIKFVAVEMNGKIIPKKMYDFVILKDGDSLEVVSFVGGG